VVFSKQVDLLSDFLLLQSDYFLKRLHNFIWHLIQRALIFIFLILIHFKMNLIQFVYIFWLLSLVYLDGMRNKNFLFHLIDLVLLLFN